jgi:hypothetical protein
MLKERKEALALAKEKEEQRLVLEVLTDETRNFFKRREQSRASRETREQLEADRKKRETESAKR